MNKRLFLYLALVSYLTATINSIWAAEDFIDSSGYQPSESYLASLETRIADLEEQNRDLKEKLDDLQYESRKLMEQQSQTSEQFSNEIKNLKRQISSLALQSEAFSPEGGVAKNDSPFTAQSIKDHSTESIENFYRVYKNDQGLSVPSSENARIIEEEYNIALDLFKQEKYYEAELAFKKFLNKYNKHQLASNAYYWVAESFFKRNKFDEAISNYLKSYRTNPTGDKASDSLFKLSKSLAAVNKPSEACITLYKLTKEFPGLPIELSKQVDDEKVRIGCTN